MISSALLVNLYIFSTAFTNLLHVSLFGMQTDPYPTASLLACEYIQYCSFDRTHTVSQHDVSPHEPNGTWSVTKYSEAMRGLLVSTARLSASHPRRNQLRSSTPHPPRIPTLLLSIHMLTCLLYPADLVRDFQRKLFSEFDCLL